MGVVIQEFGGKQHKQAIEKMLYNKNRKRSNDRNMKIKRVIALTLVTLQTIALASCGNRSDVAEMQLMTATTKQSIIDYYANSLKYDAVITRAADENKHETKYEEHEISDENTLRQVEAAYQAGRRSIVADRIQWRKTLQ